MEHSAIAKSKENFFVKMYKRPRTKKHYELICFLLLHLMLIPPNNGVDLRAPCQKFSRCFNNDWMSLFGSGGMCSLKIIAMCLLSCSV